MLEVSEYHWHPCCVLFCKLWLNLKKAYTQVWRSNSTTECHCCPFHKVSSSDRKSNNLCKTGDKHNYGLHSFELLRRTDSWTAPPVCRAAAIIYPAGLWGYVRSSWNLPVHCHTVLSVLNTGVVFIEIFLLNEATVTLSWIYITPAVLRSVRPAVYQHDTNIEFILFCSRCRAEILYLWFSET